MLGKSAGLGVHELASARRSAGSNPKAGSGLKFAQEMVSQRGQISDEAVAQVRRAGYTEIAELIANVALNIFTNCFNVVSQTEVDFPRVSAAQSA